MPTTATTKEPLPVVIIDSREQRPYQFAGPSRVAALPTGDYSIEGLEGVFAVERKTLDDFLGCVTFQRDRFERELTRASTMRRLWVVIEGNLSSILACQYRSEVKPSSVIGSIVAWECRLEPVRFVFASNRQSGEKLTERLLSRAWKEYKPSSQNAGDGV